MAKKSTKSNSWLVHVPMELKLQSRDVFARLWLALDYNHLLMDHYETHWRFRQSKGLPDKAKLDQTSSNFPDVVKHKGLTCPKDFMLIGAPSFSG